MIYDFFLSQHLFNNFSFVLECYVFLNFMAFIIEECFHKLKDFDFHFLITSYSSFIWTLAIIFYSLKLCYFSPAICEKFE